MKHIALKNKQIAFTVIKLIFTHFHYKKLSRQFINFNIFHY